MNIHERQVYSSSKIEFRPIGVIDPTDAEVIVEMRKEIARLRIDSFKKEKNTSALGGDTDEESVLGNHAASDHGRL